MITKNFFTSFFLSYVISWLVLTLCIGFWTSHAMFSAWPHVKLPGRMSTCHAQAIPHESQLGLAIYINK